MKEKPKSHNIFPTALRQGFQPYAVTSMVLTYSQVVDLLHAVGWTVCMLILYQKYIQFHKRKVVSEFKTFICRTFNRKFLSLL